MVYQRQKHQGGGGAFQRRGHAKASPQAVMGCSVFFSQLHTEAHKNGTLLQIIISLEFLSNLKELPGNKSNPFFE